MLDTWWGCNTIRRDDTYVHLALFYLYFDKYIERSYHIYNSFLFSLSPTAAPPAVSAGAASPVAETASPAKGAASPVTGTGSTTGASSLFFFAGRLDFPSGRRRMSAAAAR